MVQIPPAASAVSESRLWQLLMDVAKYGATPKGGVNRQALSAEDIAARGHVVTWAKARGFAAYQDDIGNLFVRREGEDPALAPVMTGSHLDSQPTGGKFDGAYGVLAGLEVLQALNDAGVRTKRAIEVVAWTNEEGSRFSPGAMGSSIFAGR
jgi:N-carbamoyl-L-amino-acid hydrolase